MKLTTLLIPLFLGTACVASAQVPAPTPPSIDASSPENVAIKSGESIAFMGDSITEQGAKMPGGYVQLVISGLKANGITVTPFPVGISGQRSTEMLGRLERDVLNKKPTWMTLSCGVNDVWRGETGVPLETYKANITAMVDQAQAAGVKVMILTATMIGETADNPNNAKLSTYNDFLRQLAQAKKCSLADLNADMQAAIKPGITGNQLTADGVHMNPLGDQMMATGVLRAFGLNEAQLQKARDYWIAMPQVACSVQWKLDLTLRQYQQLNELAAKENLSVMNLLQKTLSSLIPKNSESNK
jgi:lysophospholipase L1-like esterase